MADLIEPEPDPAAPASAQFQPVVEDMYDQTSCKIRYVVVFWGIGAMVAMAAILVARFVFGISYSPAGNLKTAGADTYTYARGDYPQAATRLVGAGGNRDLRYSADGLVAFDVQALEQRSLTWNAAGCLTGIVSQPEGRTTSLLCDSTGTTFYRKTTGGGQADSTRLDLAGVGEIRPEQGILLLRIPVNGTAAVEEARSLVDGSRVDSLSGYLLSDARDSVLAKTAYLPGGTPVVEAAEYDAWGATKQVDNPLQNASFPAPVHQFTGVEPDPGTGLYHFGVRAYDPSLRRWLSPDPLFLASPEKDVKSGVELNLFQYAGNNPVGNVDPGGMALETPPYRIWMEGTQKPESAASLQGQAVGLMLGALPGGEMLAKLQVDWYKHQVGNADTAEWRAGVQKGLWTAGLIKFIAGGGTIAAGGAGGVGVVIAVPGTGGTSLLLISAASTAVVGGALGMADGAATMAVANSLGSGKVPSAPEPAAAAPAPEGAEPGAPTLSTQAQKSIRSWEKEMANHQQKLEAYKANPDAFDNKGFLKNAPTPQIRQNIIDARIRHLEGEIKNFQNQIDAAKQGGGG